MPLYRYGRDEVDGLTRRDAQLGALIARIGPIEREVIPDPFVALLHSIVSQQISSKAAATVWARFTQAFEPTIEGLRDARVEDVQRIGVSMRKAHYMRAAIDAALEGRLSRAHLEALTDDEVVRELVALPGVGVWTAEMLLIFSLCRPDVVSWGDLGIRRGMMALYGLDEMDRRAFDRIRARYAPYGTVASLYLWAGHGGGVDA